MLLWPNSPLLVLLQFVDPSVLAGPDHGVLPEGKMSFLPLHKLTILVDPTSSDYSTQENQLTLGRQLIEHGANINTAIYRHGETPLHLACHSVTTTNLDFIELLLENGADPNAQDHDGWTPLMSTIQFAPGVAKFLLDCPATDVSITTSSGASFPDKVHLIMACFFLLQISNR
jgi:ankyrin repeat protein